MGTKVFLTFAGEINFYGGVEIYGGVIFITTFSLFHFIRNNQHPENELFLLQNFSGNVNASVVNCRYPQIYEKVL